VAGASDDQVAGAALGGDDAQVTFAGVVDHQSGQGLDLEREHDGGLRA
jgi:hypothetical protein